jgi:hypothetical protein
MFYLKDKSDTCWSQFTDNTMTRIIYDDGTTKDFTLEDILITRGKLAGFSLGEVSDVGYLEWIKDTNDYFQSLMANKRLVELKQ